MGLNQELKLALPKKKLLQLVPALLLFIFLLVLFKLFFTIKDSERISKVVVGNTLEPQDTINIDVVPNDEPGHQDEWYFNTQTKVDWHDHAQIERDKQRTGVGEQGQLVDVDKLELDAKLQTHLYSTNGFNAIVSDHIAIDRSLKDIRHPQCLTQKYSSELPSVSVIVPFINEHLSTLKRTFHSVINRAPRSLLKEVILVDDASTKTFLKQDLEDYIATTPVIKNIVRIVRLPERGGLITARQAGAKAAKYQVLIFLDSHTEAGYNWLPPLLEPIAENYRTVVCPFIDVIDMNNFELRAQDEGKRGSWDWELYYKRVDLLKEDQKHPSRPFKSPVMAGGLFAISAKFFWELGGYDEGLRIWGGEQYELSFKLWQCGGQMFDAPCSRIAHIYKKFSAFSSGGFGNYMSRNYKRVAEVWMDEYKEHVYKRRPDYRKIDPGEISGQLELREKLNCKSFKWFMENVAFDQPLNYPAIEPEDYANGQIQSIGYPSLCVTTSQYQERYAVDNCRDSHFQKFKMGWRKDLRPEGGSRTCLDVPGGGSKAFVSPYPCHNQKGNQLWRYDLDTYQLIHGGITRCLDMDPDTKDIFVTECDDQKQSQKWKFGKVNEKRLREWDLNKL